MFRKILEIRNFIII